MPDADFAPLRPRHHATEVAPAAREVEPTGDTASAPAEAAALRDEVFPSPIGDGTDVHDVREIVPANDERLVPPPEAARDFDDTEERAAALREEAIRFASIATARALRTTLADSGEVLTRYVDDALRACGRVVRPRVRLHPADAALYRPRRDVELIADASAERGSVTIETDAGTLGATLEERAALIARAAAHA